MQTGDPNNEEVQYFNGRKLFTEQFSVHNGSDFGKVT